MQSGLKKNNKLRDFNQKNFEKHLNFAKTFLHEGNIEESWDAFHNALIVNFESDEAKDGMKVAGFWKDRQEKLSTITDFFEKGEYLLRQYSYFILKYVPEHQIKESCGVNNIEHWVYKEAYNAFKKYANIMGDEDNSEILLKQAFCLKKMGNYEKAQILLEKAVNLSKENSSILAQLADVYSLINEDKHSKLFFREAFFIAPLDIDLDSLESILIKKILAKLNDKNYSLNELKEWIPVYGTILGIFSVKKELKPMEVGLLKQSIYTINNQLSAGDIDRRVLIPKLINHYFRLLEHLVSTKEDKGLIDEVLLNIKLLDKPIYDLYLN
ncbi:MAG: hypothetical protein B6229_04820 [Spirochaetaceae bacterium 4572_7]|nr:MAG: hypothetical protein B6229_04820 [Spirochaetaceae bacterium 4572_7]